MERDQKEHIKPGDALSTEQGNVTISTLSDTSKKDDKTLDTMHNTATITGATLVLNPAAPDEGCNNYQPGHTKSTSSLNAVEQTTTPRAVGDSNIPTQPLNDTTTTSPVSTPIELPSNDHINNATTTSLHSLQTNTNALGASLETIYNNTSSPEIKQIIACLVTLDIATTTQTRLNEAHEVHTGKNFRELRRVNKDRKTLVQDTVRSVTARLARVEGQHMAQDIMIKQGEVRTNSHGVQLKGLLDRAHMLAEGGEWAEQEISEIKQGIEAQQEEVEILKLENKGLRGQVEGLKKKVDAQKEKEKEVECLRERVASLEKEVQVLMERDNDREKRIAAMEKLFRGKE
jgi:regulator of replication initiation timing